MGTLLLLLPLLPLAAATGLLMSAIG